LDELYENKRYLTNQGIYCIEGFWNCDDNDEKIDEKFSVLPILELLKNNTECEFICHSAATKEEFKFHLKKWLKKEIGGKYPILYLACHGENGLIYLYGNTKISLDELGSMLEEKCENKIIYFGTCSTLKDGVIVREFLKKTKALAVVGYEGYVDWIPSAASDLLNLDVFQFFPLDKKGINKIQDRIEKQSKSLNKELGFVFYNSNDRNKTKKN